MANAHLKEFTKGIFKENPTFIIMLGLCPTLGVTTQVVNAIGMGAGVLFVLLFSNIFISLLKNVIPNSVRIPAYIVIIASFVTIVEMVMHAFAPSLYESLGIFLPLIVVNCIILGRAEAFANKNSVFDSILDAIGMSVGFTLALLLIAALREGLGAGTWTLFAIGSFDGVIKIPVLFQYPIRIMTLAAGALLIMGFLKAFFNWKTGRKRGKIMAYIGIVITYIFINNFILTQFIGLCPFIGVSKNSESALGMGMAVTFVMGLASLITWLVYNFLLVPLSLEYLQTLSFILVIAALVQLVELVIQKNSPALYQALGIFLPLITTNCAVLGIALINITQGYNLMESFTAGIAGGLGFTLAIILMSNLREKLDLQPVRKSFKGVPIAFVSGGLMALAFMAFDKALLSNLLG
jgi:RnfABCDGE-type electron transport complex A subunit/RnfABCDGE-type electron transport complex E subunit